MSCQLGALTCIPIEQPKPEECNGLDDDCDGAVDENNPGGNAECNTGAPGICALGTTNCTNGSLDCVQNAQPQTEICNGLDDDCDGTPDQGFPGAGQPCTVTGQTPNTPCAAGLTNCLGGQSGCTQTTFPDSEVCDGVDNDCNGVLDDPSVLDGASCSTGLMGVCAAGKTKCSSGTLGCVPDIQPGVQPETCNALDDDCDGTVDNVSNLSLECSAKLPQAGKVASWACTAGFCSVVSCVPNWGDCDLTPSTGCETDLLKDPTNCSACGNICNSSNGSGYCDLGTCKIACDSGFGNCDGNAGNGCETPLISTTHCGGCGLACTNAHGATVCASGTCVPTCSNGFGDCDGNPNNGCETNLGSNVNHCGACGSACSNPNGTTQCSGGTCAPSCTPGWSSCDANPNNGCETNLQTSTNHCGSCGTACTNANGNTSCVAGACSPTCSAGTADCDGNPNNGCETSTTSNVNHCGACGTQCTNAHGSTACISGTCTPSCSGTFASCDGNPNNGCEADLATSTGNCGACGSVCTNPNGNTSCIAGACAPVCSSGWGNCDSNAKNGCETETAVDVDNCGTCGTVCTNAHGSTSCVAGACAPVCSSGWGNCDSSLTNGCETNTNSDVDNCGTCGNKCTNPNGSVSCSGGTCQLGCAPGFADCDGSTGNGCEQNISSSVNHCGGCNIQCTNAHGTTQCSSGACVPSCTAGWGNCDGDSTNGCETNTSSNVLACGGCGIVCSNAHGTTQCSAGACIPSCAPGWGNCDGNPYNGCETNLQTDEGNCGTCGTTCSNPSGTTECISGVCTPVCGAGAGNCDGDPNNGCETSLLTTINHCGVCGNACTNAHGTTQCSGGVCAPSCSGGYASCDGLPGNGCETNTTNDSSHCGTCGNSCTNPLPPQATGASCQSSSCEVTGCTSGWHDQDTDHANGCECQADAVANTCGSAFDLGTVPINALGSVNGNLTPTGDQDWYRIEFQYGATCAYNPKITLNAGGLPIRMQVFKNCSNSALTCTEGSSGVASGWASWELTYTGACGEQQAIDPTPGSGAFVNTAHIPVPTVLYVRVFPTASSASCLSYTLSWSN